MLRKAAIVSLLFCVAFTAEVLSQSASAQTPNSVSRGDVLEELNRQRARKRLPPFIYDESLTRWAAKEAETVSRYRTLGHRIPITRTGARGGGVGYSSGRDYHGKKFLTCLMWSRQYRRAGAALYVKGNRTYYALFLK